MLPLSHIYVSTKVVKISTDLLVFGSVLPDFSWTSRTQIGRDQIHYAPKQFYEYIIKKNPEFSDLALGSMLHSNINNGADFYSDDLENGFAKIEGRKIESEVANLLADEIGETTLQLAHSYIEASVDILLNKSNPEMLNLYEKSIKNLNMGAISECLSTYLKINSRVVLKEINNLLNFVGPGSYVTEDKLHNNLVAYIKQSRGKDVDKIKSNKILEKAKMIMSDKYKNYLNIAIDNMQKDFINYIRTKHG